MRRDFEWDPRKAAANLLAHRVSFEVAIAVFADPELVEIDASRAEDGEPRMKAIGRIEGRLFTLVLTARGDVTRLISAGRANRNEERAYDAHPPSP